MRKILGRKIKFLQQNRLKQKILTKKLSVYHDKIMVDSFAAVPPAFCLKPDRAVLHKSTTHRSRGQVGSCILSFVNISLIICFLDSRLTQRVLRRNDKN